MSYPKFFDTVETIKVRDRLLSILGGSKRGEYEFTYLDVVKSAGHSCPAVAGAYLITLEAMKILYPNEPVVRGDVKVEFKESLTDGVRGVIANVVTQITGATDKSGFKGLNGNHARHSLMYFDADIGSQARFTRVDSGKSVDVSYDPSCVKPDSAMQPLMQKVMQGVATSEESKEFGKLWQDRVRRILENSASVINVVEV